MSPLDFISTEYPYLGKDEIDELLWLVILGGFVCFAMAWGIGANDVANAFSTSVGARAINLKQATVIAGIFEFIGAVGLGANVTSTVRKGIVDWDAFIGQEDILMLGMFSSLLSAAIWLALATKYSLPVSTTQSVVGAIAGFAICFKGSDSIHWIGQYEDGKLVKYNGVLFIALFWILTPLFAAIGAVLFFVPIRNCLLRRNNSYKLTLRWWPLFVFIVVFVMALFLLIKGLQRLEFDYEESLGLSFGITTAIAAGVALIAWFIFVRSGLVEKHVENWVSTHPSDDTHSAHQIPVSDDEEEPCPNSPELKQPVSPNDLQNQPRNELIPGSEAVTPKQSVSLVTFVQQKLEKPQLDDQQSGALISVVQGLLETEQDPELGNVAGSQTEMTSTNGHTHEHTNGDTNGHTNCHNPDTNGHLSAEEEDVEAQRKFSSEMMDAEKGNQGSKAKLLMQKSISLSTKGLNVDIHDDMTQLEMDIQNNAEKFDPKTDRAFAWLQVCTASLDIFAHGSNDVANAVAPFAAMISLWQYGEARDKVEVYEWILVLGALGMVLGLATYGYKIMKCLGVKMAPMTCTRGYSIELASAIVVILASMYGFPTSTTHAQVGATVGIGLVELSRPDTKLRLRQVVNWKLLAQVIFGWVLTLFISGITSALIFSAIFVVW